MTTFDEELCARLAQENGFEHVKIVRGRVFAVQRFIYTTGLLVGVDEWSYEHRYCFPNHADAVEAFKAWDGEGVAPGNWIKRKGRGGDIPNPSYSADG